MKFAITAVAATLFLAGCPSGPEPTSQLFLQRMTPIPISMTAKVEHPPRDSPDLPTITLSDGGVMGLSCAEYCVDDIAPRQSCENTTATLTASGIAELRDVFLLSGAHGARVLIAKAPGTTVLTVTSPCVSADYRVVVEPFEP